jgi:hypothetical protein
MAVACLQGNGIGSEIYPRKEQLVYWRAVMDGMPPVQANGEKTDPKTFFKPVDYEYLGLGHIGAMRSYRSEVAGARGIRGRFAELTGYNPDTAGCTRRQVEKMHEKAGRLKGEEPVQLGIAGLLVVGAVSFRLLYFSRFVLPHDLDHCLKTCIHAVQTNWAPSLQVVSD